MRCCVSGCKNDSRHLSKSQGITFHAFPMDTNLRRAWLKALAKDGWEPKERSAVCSEHFSLDDLYQTRNGLRKVRNGAVPVAVQVGYTFLEEKGDASSSVYTDPVNLNVCRICLTTSGKLYSIKRIQLEQAFEHLSGLTLKEEDKLPQKLCVECAQRLRNCSRFRAKSLRANSVLTDLVNRQDFLTTQLISTIDRHFYRLDSDLSTKHFTDHYDLTLEYTDESNTDLDIEIKNESPDDLFLNETDFGQESVKDEDSCQEIVEAVTYPIVTDVPLAEETRDDEEHPTEEDQEFATELGFSSDDSIPLKLATRAKQMKRKKDKLLKEQGGKKVRARPLAASRSAPAPKVDRRRKPFLNADLNETLFTITDLTFDEQIAEIQKRQESANYKNAVYKCTECYKGFLDEDAYGSHMSRHTKECGDYQCAICKTHFKHPHALRKHITAHHTQRFSCNQCPYVTTHRQTARLHERWHKGTKYQCPHCPDEFVKFTTYMGHIRIKHPSDFVCQLCGFSFVSQKGIELHKKLKHRLDSGEVCEGPTCEECNVRFASAEALAQHRRVSARHNRSDADVRESNKPKKGRKSAETKERDRIAKEKNEQLYAGQGRRAEGPIPCEQCGIQLEDSRAYHGHFRRAHPDKNRTNYPSMRAPCMCEQCGRMFQSYALLKDHRWTHTGERPFKCEQCGKSFRMKQRLVAHQRVHSSVKASYVCNLCGKHFSTHSNRQRHMFIHTGLKPFKCELCGKGFKHASEKRAHVTYVHLKKPWPKRSRKRRADAQAQGGQVPPPQPHLPTGGGELPTPQPPWACDKTDMHSLMDDKPLYYNLKI